jgi:hypothetical protein
VDNLPVTGVTASTEHALSSALIDMPERPNGGYGTLSSTLMWLAAKTGTGVLTANICEKTIHAAAHETNGSEQQMVRLTWPLRG